MVMGLRSDTLLLPSLVALLGMIFFGLAHLLAPFYASELVFGGGLSVAILGGLIFGALAGAIMRNV